jgi:hypothetical protein
MLASMFLVGASTPLRNARRSAAKPDRHREDRPDGPQGGPVRCRSRRTRDAGAHQRRRPAGAAALRWPTGARARLRVHVLAGLAGPDDAGRHRFWEYTDKQERKQQQLQFFKNLSALGGSSSRPGTPRGSGRRCGAPAGPPGRASRGGHFAGTARREVKLAAAERAEPPSARAASIGCAGDDSCRSLAPHRGRPRRSTSSCTLPGSKSLTNRALVLAALATAPPSYAGRSGRATPCSWPPR